MTEDVVTHEPVRAVVVRWRCPFCGRSHSDRPRTRRHMERCWFNPAAKSCKTCRFFQPAISDCAGTPGCGCGNEELCHKGLAVAVPTELRPDRMTFPLHCAGWELAAEERVL